jgi:hypothetical protein
MLYPDPQPCLYSQERYFVGEPVQQPVFVIIKQCLPVFNKICANFAGDGEVIDAVCAVLKQGVTTLQVQEYRLFC